MHFITEFSNIVKTIYDAKFQLGAIPDDLSGVSILTHGYSQYALPTWHATAFTEAKNNIISADTYATKIKYLQPQTYSKKQDLKYDQDSVVKKLTSWLYLVSKGSHDPDNEPSSDAELAFDEERHVFPQVQWLQPYSQGDQALSYSMISGLLIESFEIDGSSVPLPDTTIGMRNANNLFLQGSLPLCNIHQGYSTSAYAPFNRAVMKKNAQKISIDLYNMAENRLPQFDEDTNDATAPTHIPGFTLVEHVRNFASAYTKVSFTTLDEPPTAERFFVWSPYRHVVNEEDAIPTEKQILMLFNHRCLYGTSVPLTGTEHPASIIPIS